MRTLLLNTLGCLVAVLLAAAGQVKAGFIYVADVAGDVGKFDTTSNTGTPLGNLNAFSIDQVVGIAFDPASNAVLLLDRRVFAGGPARVYAMDANTGSATFLFNAVSGFEGGAVTNSLLYGLVSLPGFPPNPVQAYSLPDGVSQGLMGGPMPFLTHGMGVDPATGQLYIIDREGAFTIRRVNDDGTVGSAVITPAPGSFTFPEDIDFFNGNFLVADQQNGIKLVNGTNGTVSKFLTPAQLTAMGVSRSPFTGVAVEAVVAEPSTFTLLGMGMLGIAIHSRWRWKRLRRLSLSPSSSCAPLAPG